MERGFPHKGDLSGWTDFLAATQIPMLASSRAALTELGQSLDASPADLASVGLRDPLFAVAIIRHLQNHKNRLRIMDITTIEHAVMMMGVNPFLKTFQDGPTVESACAGRPVPLQAILSLARRGYVASRLAQHWAALSNDMRSEEIQVAALIHDVAEMLLWLRAPGHAFAIRQSMAAHPGERSAHAQRGALGFALNEAEAEICARWGLPELLIELFQDRPKTYRMKLVQLAVRLARHVSTSWSDPALPDDWADIAACHPLGFDDAHQAREVLMPMAQSFIDRWDRHNLPPEPADDPTDGPTPESADGANQA